MAVVVNTNTTSLQVQKNLNAATSSMNTAMERMSTGLKINSAKDDAAGMAVSAGLEKMIGASGIAQSNSEMCSNMLTVTEGNLEVMRSNLLRIRDLYEQAGNDTYGSTARSAITEEVRSRFQEIDRLAKAADFNGIKLLDGAGAFATSGARLQVGTDSNGSSAITLDKSIFAKAGISSLGITGLTGLTSNGISAATTANLKLDTAAGAAGVLASIDTAIDNIVTRQTKIGAAQNRLSSAVEAAQVQEINLTASNSQIKDADIAEESSAFVKAQILQQSSASLLSQANQIPAVALSLV